MEGEGVSRCFVWGLSEDRVCPQLSRFPKPSLPPCAEQAALMTSNFYSSCAGPQSQHAACRASWA